MPDEITSWSGHFIAVWPDGTQSDFFLDGYTLRVGDAMPGREDLVLDRYDATTGPQADGRPVVVGHFAKAVRVLKAS